MPSNSLTKEILENDEFWCALKRLLPTTADNLTIKYKGQVLQDPLQRPLVMFIYQTKNAKKPMSFSMPSTCQKGGLV